MRDGRTDKGSPRRIAGALRGREAVDAEWHPDSWMRARCWRLIRKAGAAGDRGGPEAVFPGSQSPGSQSGADGSRGPVPRDSAGGA